MHHLRYTPALYVEIVGQNRNLAVHSLAAEIHHSLFDHEYAAMLEAQAAGTDKLHNALARLPPEEARTAILIDD